MGEQCSHGDRVSREPCEKPATHVHHDQLGDFVVCEFHSCSHCKPLPVDPLPALRDAVVEAAILWLDGEATDEYLRRHASALRAAQAVAESARKGRAT